MKRRDVLIGGAAAAVGSGLARPSIAQPAKVLKFVPQANLSSLDPIWTTATVAAIHGYAVWDLLYGLDEKLVPRPQMAAGDEVSSDGLTFTITLRDGLVFTDGVPVRAADCVQSIIRWSKRNPMGGTLMSRTNELVALDDKRLQFRLKQRFPLLTYVLGGEGCYIMPERIAKTDAFTQITEIVGSGPFRYLPDEYVSGASVAYARNDKYIPRQEAPSMWAGGKVAYFDRVEFKIIPDPATASAALQRGEIDWWEQALPDLLPNLLKNPSIRSEVLDPLGALGVVRFNHLNAPFNNVKLRRAFIPALDQNDITQAAYGDLAGKLSRSDAGFFTTGSPFASNVGMDALLGKRDMALARKLVKESGYAGEEIVLMAPTDQPILFATAQVINQLMKDMGLNVKFASMDWGTLISRRAKKEPSSQGGWDMFCTTWSGLSTTSPGNSQPMRENGLDGWFGWAKSDKMEALRDQWFDAPTLPEQQEIAKKMQLLAIEEVPFLPTGMFFTPTAYRSSITGLIKSGTVLMWGVKPVSA
jgi:peptide/nickel transport system substrate-binding protein